MKISVGTSNNTLDNILSVDQIQTISRASNSKAFDSLFINNNHSSISIYIEFGDPATVANGFPLLPGESIAFEEGKLSDVNLIAEGSINDDIRILGN